MSSLTRRHSRHESLSLPLTALFRDLPHVALYHVSGAGRALVVCVPACLYVRVSYLHMHECAYTNVHTCIFTCTFAMWQVLSGDSWASAVARSIFAPDRTDADVAFFFVSYILIAAVMLLNVVVAVLLVITNARGFQIDVGETSHAVN